MKIVHLTGGTGGFWCGTCVRDAALVDAWRRLGHDAALMPLYLPVVAEVDACRPGEQVRMGGIGVWMAAHVPGWRFVPRFLADALAAPSLLARVAATAGSTRPESLGSMTLAMLAGVDGPVASEVWPLLDAVRAEAPDVVVLSNSLLAGLAPALSAHVGVPVVCTVQGEGHFVDALGAARDAAWRDIGRGLAACADVVAVSASAASHVASATAWTGRPFAVIPNGVGGQAWGPPAPGSPPVLAFLARLYPPKGADRLLDLAERLRAKHPDLRVRIAGTVQAGDRSYVDALRAGAGAHVEIHENVTPTQKRALLASATVFCVPTRKEEAFGHYNLEAMAWGVRVVAPDGGANREVIGMHGGGVVVPDDDDALVEALDALLDDPARARALGAAGRQSVTASGTVDMAAAAWLERLEGVVAARGAA